MLADPAVVDHRDPGARLAELLTERRRHDVDGANQQNHVEGSLAGMAGARILAREHHHVVDRELLEGVSIRSIAV